MQIYSSMKSHRDEWINMIKGKLYNHFSVLYFQALIKQANMVLIRPIPMCSVISVISVCVRLRMFDV